MQDGKISVAGSVDIETLKKALTTPEAAKYKVLELPAAAVEALIGIWDTFQGTDKDKLVQRLKHQTSVVCCLQKQPGWVWYDFFHDIPHVDRFQRKFDDGTKLRFYLGDAQELGYQEK